MQQPRKVSHAHTFFIIFGSIEVIFASIFGFSVIPSLSELYKKMNLVTYTPVMMYIGIIILSILALIQIVIGVYLYIKQKKSQTIEDLAKKSFRFIFVPSTIFFTLLMPFLIVSILMPVYKLTTEIDGSPTPTPISPTPTPDPTANWKTYRNQQFAFEFRYPESFDLREQEGKDPAYELRVYSAKYKSPYVELWFQVSTKSEEVILEGLGESISDKESFVLNGIKMNKYVGYGGPAGGVYHERVFFKRGDLTYNFNLGSYNKQSINQILQTFKFTDQTEGVACTQDVKQCPDGSYVGREPPSCEFRPCPNQ